MSSTLIGWLGAVMPLIVVLALMLGRRMGAGWAGLAGWLAASFVAALGFGAGLDVLLVAQGKAVLLSAYVLYIIVMAMLFYHTLSEAGAIQAIGARLVGLTKDRALLALLLAWTFGSFLQGVSGYGIPTAIVAPMLVGIGFTPVKAVVMASMGHAWAVSFGSLGASFEALLAATGSPASDLAPMSAAFLGFTCLGCGLVVLWVVDALQAVRRGIVYLVPVGLVMAGTQYGLAAVGLYPFAAVGAGLAGIIVMVLLISGREWVVRKPLGAIGPIGGLPLLGSLLPYGLLILIIGSAELFPPLKATLNALILRFDFQEVQTARGYITPAETGRTISVFGHPGALLGYATLLVYGLFHWRGAFGDGAAQRILHRTLRGILMPVIGVSTMVAMAVTMEHSGMTRLLAEGLSSAVGAAFPGVSPYIGALGAFMTGSNTNSNVIFGALQQDTARVLSLRLPVILAAQTTGAAIGGAFAPAKVIVGCSTVGLAGNEGGALKGTVTYGLLLLAGVALATLLFAWS